MFIISDFAGYCAPGVPLRLAVEFHKVHHSAPVMVPLTASRVHFLEKIVGRLVDLVLLGAYAGIFLVRLRR